MRKSDMTPKIDIWDSTSMILLFFQKCSLSVFVMSRHILMTRNVPKTTLAVLLVLVVVTPVVAGEWSESRNPTPQN